MKATVDKEQISEGRSDNEKLHESVEICKVHTNKDNLYWYSTSIYNLQGRITTSIDVVYIHMFKNVLLSIVIKS